MMFKPIKNLITFIQNNANGSGVFGGPSTVAQTEEVVVSEIAETEEKVTPSMERKTKLQKSVVKTPTKRGPSIEAGRTIATKRVTPNYDADDIELQIKSSIMIKKPMKTSPNNRRNVTVQMLRKTVIMPQSRDHNQNHEESINVDELEDTPHDLTNTSGEDYFSVSSGGEQIVDLELDLTENEDEFVDLTQDIETFPDSEIIVINEAELNTSIASDAPSEDPLAIDEFAKDTSINLDSSTNDEPPINTDVVWICDDDVEITEITPNKRKDLCGSTTPKSRSILQSMLLTKNTPNSREEKKKSNSVQRAEELRSDGSDSGLGSESSALRTNTASGTNTSQMSSVTSTPTQTSTQKLAKQTEVVGTTDVLKVAAVLSTGVKIPLRSNLKRTLDVSSNALNSSKSSADAANASQQKRPKRSVNFDTVQVYYFARQQGFGCVPSAGGCTLGMGAQHISFKTLSLAEHAAEIRRAHRSNAQEINTRGSSSDESEESEEDYLSDGSGSDYDADSSGFLQPVSPKQRRAILKAAGVRKIDASEKVECRDIRNSREVCGCSCRDFCDPETCACSQAGIKCQVDRSLFPCGCSRDACGNSVGRIEFNPTRVRTHYIHTLMRLEMENRHQPNPSLCGNSTMNGYGVASTIPTSGATVAQASTSNGYYNLQPHSNYSSGYASPAYTNDQTANYYQGQSAHYGTEVHPQAPQYQLDSLDAGLFSTATNSTPSYGELMPAYGGMNTPTAPPTYHSITYTPIANGLPSQGATYTSYHQETASYHSISITPTGYNSCAAPSVPPYGAATTTAASALFQNNNEVVLETIAPSCGSNDAENSNYINLSTPITSSSRLSQINDLLQHNRNTTAALVAVSQAPCNPLSLTNSVTICSVSAATASIDTPPIEVAHKSCLTIEALPPPPLNPTPIVAVQETGCGTPTKAPLRRPPPPTPSAMSVGAGAGVGVKTKTAPAVEIIIN